jgi:PAS domain S-box-containing protein
MNEYLAAVIDAANEGIYVTDRERRFLLWNSTAARIAGYTKDEIIGRSCHDNILCHTDDEGRSLCFSHCPLQAAIDAGQPQGPEVVYLRHKNGTRIAVEVRTAPIRDEAGAVIGGVEIFQDVTERLANERLLRGQKHELEAGLDSINDGILFLDTDGTISVVNRTCASLFGANGSVHGTSIRSLPDGSALKGALDAVEEAFQRTTSDIVIAGIRRCPEGQGAFRCWTAAIDQSHPGPRSACFNCTTYRIVRSFLERPVELTQGDRTLTAVSTFIEAPDANELREVIVFHDASAEKLDAALKVAGAAAHELRQPLQVIIVVSDLLRQALRRNKEQRANAEMLLQSCKRMDGIIRKMCEITAYRTRDYVQGSKILDLAGSAAPDGEGNKQIPVKRG